MAIPDYQTLMLPLLELGASQRAQCLSFGG